MLPSEGSSHGIDPPWSSTPRPSSSAPSSPHSFPVSSRSPEIDEKWSFREGNSGVRFGSRFSNRCRPQPDFGNLRGDFRLFRNASTAGGGGSGFTRERAKVTLHFGHLAARASPDTIFLNFLRESAVRAYYPHQSLLSGSIEHENRSVGSKKFNRCVWPTRRGLLSSRIGCP